MSYDFSEFNRALAATVVSTEQAAAAFTEAAKAMRRNMDIAREIELVRMNPSLSRFQKWRLIRGLKKEARRC